MSDLEIKNIVGKKIERYKNRLKAKEVELEVLLDFISAINLNFSTAQLVDKFKHYVKEQLQIEKLVLFSKYSNWRRLLEYGLKKDAFDLFDVERDLLHLKDITSVTTIQNDALKDFDLVVPVYHGEIPVAYLVIGDVKNDEGNVSGIIKHLNFLQILTNVVVSAIENHRLAREVLQKEQEKTKLIENQKEMLEDLVEKRTSELKSEKEESERLLSNILPKSVADELKQKGFTTPKRFSNATILFTDFKEFTQASSTISPQVLVGELNDIFMAFDFIIEKNGLEKIKTIGDSYMAASGLPKRSKNHAVHVVRAGFEMLSYLETRKQHIGIRWEMRVGIHSGPVVAGVVGAKKFTYDIWGDTVNLASRMESNSFVGRINISKKTEKLINDFYKCDYRGKLAVKGKGNTDMYFVLHEKESKRFKKLKEYVVDLLTKKLSPTLCYHNLDHTLGVCNAATTIALYENVGMKGIELLRSAALLHDSGFTKQYKDNEERGCEIARTVLARFGYNAKEIKIICGIIMATKIPQTPKTQLEEIICDADLDTLGRSDYDIHAKNLVDELNANGSQLDATRWRDYQVKFLSSHHYFTQTSRSLREDVKQKNLERVKNTHV